MSISNSSLNIAARGSAITALGESEFDILVIGGGINGVGIALDAASRGLSVALVESGDFASGTSSKSSKLIHGGLRYLEQYDFRLVREALYERELMVTTLSPIFNDFFTSSSCGNNCAIFSSGSSNAHSMASIIHLSIKVLKSSGDHIKAQ